MYTQANFKIGSHLLILLLLPLLSYSQYLEWPKGEARWVYTIIEDGRLAGHTYAHQYGDTIINGKNYHFIEDEVYVDYMVNGFIRSEDNRVYLWPRDSLQEFVIYDYNLNEGDSFDINGWSIIPYHGKTQVWGPYEYEENGIILEEYHVHWCDTWIKGIGNIWSATKIAGFCSVSGNSYLTCCTHNDTLVYGGYWHCKQFLPVSVDETNTQSEILSYPNPTDAILHLEIPESTIKRMYLINVIGELDPLPIQTTLDLSEYPPGTYYLHINTSQGNIVREIIIQR